MGYKIKVGVNLLTYLALSSKQHRLKKLAIHLCTSRWIQPMRSFITV